MKGLAPTMGWMVLGLLFLISFGLDVANVTQGGAIDLRNRITGIRLLAHQIDPYHYKWHEPEPEEYGDPYNNPLLKVSKTTATPALLLLHLPLAELPYRLAQFLWFLLQWLLLLGTAWLWWRACATSRQCWLLALCTVAFTYTSAWRLHAERGQAYVLLLFLLACWLIATLDPKKGNCFLTGLLAGVLITLRPPFLLLLPFLALHRRGQLAGAAVGLVLGIGLPMLWDGTCWSDYASAMQTYSVYYRADISPHDEQAYPATMEGIPTESILAYYVPIPYADFSAHALLRWLGFAPFPALPLILALVVSFALWLWLSRDQRLEALLLGMTAWLFLADFFLPAYRNSYNDVLILNVLALALVTSPRIPRAAWPCMVALPLGWGIYVIAPTQAWLINLPTLFFTLSALLLLFFSNNRASGPKVKGAC